MTTIPQSSPKRRTALLMLTLVCVFWGFTFPLMKTSFPLIGEKIAENPDQVTPMAFLAMRFTLATILMPLAFLPALLARLRASRSRAQALAPGALVQPKRRLWSLLWISFALSVLFTGSFYLQVFGLRDTTPAVSAFLTSLYVIFTPMIVLAFARKLPGWRMLASALVALVGVGFIAYTPELTLDALVADWGVMLSLACAVGFGAHIVFTDYATKREDPAMLSLLMMVFASLFALGVMATALVPAAMIELFWAMLQDWGIMWRMLVMVVFATTFAVFAWNRWQKDLGPTRASLLYTLEPVFAMIISLNLGEDTLRWQLFMGGGLILGANLFCELAAARRRRLDDMATI